MNNQITETRDKTSLIYKIISYISLIYILYLPIRALTLNTMIAIYSIPTLLITIISIYFLTQKKLSYNLTIQFKKAVCWIVIIMMAVSIICFDLVRDQYNYSYSLSNFWKNIFITNAYNNLFFFSYNILVLFILGTLLTFNNISSIIKYYEIREKIYGYSPLYINTAMLVFIFIVGLTMFKEINQITSNLFYFFVITYSSFFISIFISRIIINILVTITSFLKGQSNE